MKNFVQLGNTLTLTAASDVASGEGFLVGSIFAVANHAAKAGEQVEGDVVGVHSLPRATGAGTDYTQGTKAYWDAAAKKVTKTAAGNTLIGAFTQGAAVNDAASPVRLNGTV